MIHQLLNLTRPFFVLDTETTGTDVKTDRIVELAFQKWEPVSEAARAAGHDGMTKEWRSLVNPGVPMPPAVQEIHGIGDSDFLNCRTCMRPLKDHPIGKSDEILDYACVDPRGWPTFKQLAPNLAKGFADCDYAGKNIRFDLRIVVAEFARAGVPWTIGDARLVDADQLERLLNPRSLSHLYRKYTGQKLDGAHGALADVRATTAVISGQLQATLQNDDDEGIMLPRNIGQLHALSFPGMIDLEGKFRFVKGVPCFTQWGKYANKPMTTADNGYWDWILRESFSADVKTIAGRAKLKKFPEEKHE